MGNKGETGAIGEFYKYHTTLARSLVTRRQLGKEEREEEGMNQLYKQTIEGNVNVKATLRFFRGFFGCRRNKVISGFGLILDVLEDWLETDEDTDGDACSPGYDDVGNEENRL